MLKELQADELRDLVIVTYGPDHDTLAEWVYNAADIDAATVVWARDMGREKNQELIDYFKERRVWGLFADEVPPRLVPYK